MALVSQHAPCFRPYCDKCGKPVEFMQWDFDVMRQGYLLYMACHGEKYTKNVSLTEMEQQPIPYFGVFRAFTPEDGFPRPEPKACKRALAL